MTDPRRFTGTKTLQTAWTVAALAVAAVLFSVVSPGDTPVVLGIWGGVWLLGLLTLGWRDRRHWRRLVANSTFEQGSAAGRADLQAIVHGQSVTVATDVPRLRSQTHLVVSATVEGVDAEFTITAEHVGSGGAGSGLETGNPTLDESWVIEGGSRNVSLLLSPDVQSALMDVTVPGTATVTGERVVYRIPFTRVSASELADCADAVAAMAARLEAIGRGERSPTG